MNIVIILIVAAVIYAVFAVLRGAARFDERKNEQIYEAKMHAAADAVDEAADRDATKV